MKEFFSSLRRDRILLRFNLLSLFIVAATSCYSFISYKALPPLIPLYNQLPWGETRLAPSWGIFLPEALVFGILIVNIFLSALVYKQAPLVGRILATTSFLISILTFLFIFRTIQIIL